MCVLQHEDNLKPERWVEKVRERMWSMVQGIYVHCKYLHTRPSLFSRKHIHTDQKGASRDQWWQCIMNWGSWLETRDLTLNLQKKEGKEGQGRQESEWRVTLVQALLLWQSVVGEAALWTVLKGGSPRSYRMRTLFRKLLIEEIIKRGALEADVSIEESRQRESVER